MQFQTKYILDTQKKQKNKITDFFMKRKKRNPEPRMQPDSKRLEDHCYLSGDFGASQELHSGGCRSPLILSGFCLF